MRKILNYFKFLFYDGTKKLNEKSDRFVKINFWCFWALQLLTVSVPLLIILITKETITKENKFTFSGYLIIFVLFIVIYSQIKAALKITPNGKIKHLFLAVTGMIPYALIYASIFIVTRHSQIVLATFGTIVLIVAASKIVGALANWFKDELARRNILEAVDGVFSIKLKDAIELLKSGKK